MTWWLGSGGQGHSRFVAPSRRQVVADLPPDLTAPSVARRVTRATLATWQVKAVQEAVLLVVSELVTNAVRHGLPPVRLALQEAARGVRVEVHDGDAHLPRSAGAPSAAESGRGLRIVEQVSTATGASGIPGDGKVVWAVVTDDV